jgi:hypothetical protein
LIPATILRDAPCTGGFASAMRTGLTLILVLFLGLAWTRAGDAPPRFTEEREAAAVYFVRKHAPEVLPLLMQLKKDSPTQYQHEIREVFYVTELLAELMDDPKRHELELRIWKAESRARALTARLSIPAEDERKKVEANLQEMARELVELDIQVLELKAEQLDKELSETKEELVRTREQIDKATRTRYEGLVGKVKKPRR